MGDPMSMVGAASMAAAGLSGSTGRALAPSFAHPSKTGAVGWGAVLGSIVTAAAGVGGGCVAGIGIVDIL